MILASGFPLGKCSEKTKKITNVTCKSHFWINRKISILISSRKII